MASMSQPARSPCRTGRYLRFRTGARRRGGQARALLRGYGRASAQEHCTASEGLQDCNWPDVCTATDDRTAAPGQAVDSGAALCQHERRPRAGVFADGMVEEITTAISRLPWLFVIARNSSFTYKGKAVDVKQVARELGVGYVLEGGVRKAGNRVRITGQLIDTTTGAHIW